MVRFTHPTYCVRNKWKSIFSHALRIRETASANKGLPPFSRFFLVSLFPSSAWEHTARMLRIRETGQTSVGQQTRDFPFYTLSPPLILHSFLTQPSPPILPAAPRSIKRGNWTNEIRERPVVPAQKERPAEGRSKDAFASRTLRGQKSTYCDLRTIVARIH